MFSLIHCLRLSGEAKVSDYGTVNLIENTRTVMPGNPQYAAPEARRTYTALSKDGHLQRWCTSS